MTRLRWLIAVFGGLGLVVALGEPLLASQQQVPPKEEEAAEPKVTPPAKTPGPPAGMRGMGGMRRGMGQGGPGMGGPGRGGPGMGGPGMGRGGHPMGRPRWPHQDWDTLQSNDPTMYQLMKDDYDLERQARELVIQYRRAPESQRAAIRKRLQETTNKHFEARQKRRLMEVKRLEEELKRLREAIDHRNEARNEIVGKRVAELLGEDDLDF